MEVEQGESSSEDELFPIEHYDQVNDAFDYTDPAVVSGLLKCVCTGCLDTFKNLIKKGKSVNINDNRGNTPLHVAVLTEKKPFIDYLLSIEETQINAQNFQHETPLMLSIKGNNSEILLKLIEAGGDINMPDISKSSPLHVAVKKSPILSKILIDHGANINARDDFGETPLIEAVRDGTLETVCLLLYYGADTNITSENNISPFMFAIIFDDMEKQEALLDYENDFNRESSEGMTTLYLAITHNSPFTVDIIKQGADVNYTTEINSYDSLKLSLCFQNYEAFKIIWERVNYQETWLSEPSILYFIASEVNDFYHYFRYILESEKVCDAVDALRDSEDVVNVFLSRCFNYGNFPFSRVEELIYILLSYGTQLSANSIENIYEYRGDCPFFRTLIQMTVDIPASFSPVYIFPFLCHNTELTLKRHEHEILQEFFADANEDKVKNNIAIVTYFSSRTIFKSHNLVTDIIPVISTDLLTQVPSLKELSRNQIRCNISKSCKGKSSIFYALIKSLDIPVVCQRIISFEDTLYKCDFVDK